MPRNTAFHSTREPFRDEDALQLQHSRTAGPFSFLNPTNARFHHTGTPYKSLDDDSNGDDEKATPGQDERRAANVAFLWRSRDNRKGRHTLLVQAAKPGEDAPYTVPPKTSEARQIFKNILRMVTYFPYWDISWLVAIMFTLGSVVWVLNAFFVWLPAVDPQTTFPTEIAYGGGITAFLGAIVFFETGSILLIFEAFNENSAGCFGWAVEALAHGETSIRPEQQRCIHHHSNRKNFVGKSSHDTHPDVKPTDENTKDGRSWQWCPSWHMLTTHYLHEIGFLAGCAQLFGATIFGISGFTALPGVQNHLSQPVLNGIYWVPQMVGGTGFIVSGTLYMLETQKNWYTPALGVLGWHIGFWNWIGAWGFTLSGALGPAYGNSGCQYQAGLATFWGSWAFLIGSVLQWYESLDTHPVERMPPDQVPSKSVE